MFRLVGALVTLQPEFGFVLEEADTGRVCGYALATLDSRQHATKTDVAWLPAMRQKYPKPDKTELLTPAEVNIPLIYCKNTKDAFISQRVTTDSLDCLCYDLRDLISNGYRRVIICTVP